MNIASIETARAAVRETAELRQARLEQEKLKQACRDFEGFFIGIIMKEGLLPSLASEQEDSSGSSAGLHELAIEQVARQLGDNGTMGLADVLYRQFMQSKGDPLP